MDAPRPVVAGAEPEMGAGGRVAAMIAAVVLAFLAAVALVAMLEITDLTPCKDVTDPGQLNADGECFDGSGARHTLSLILGWPGAILAAASVLAAIGVALRGRGVRLLVSLVAGAVVLFGLSIVAGSI